MKMNGMKILTWAVTGIASAMVIMSGAMKLIGGEQIVTALTKAGVQDYITVLGLMEISFAALFLYPKTMKVGFLLLTCYFAGAIATDLSHGNPMIGAVIILTLVWIAAFLRDRMLFLPSTKQSA